MKNILLSLMLVIFVSACSHKSTPQFSIAPGDVVTVSVGGFPGKASSPSTHTKIVQVGLSSAAAAELRQFSKDHLNQRVQIAVGTNVVEELTFVSELSRTNFALFYSSPQKAQEVADLLSKK